MSFHSIVGIDTVNATACRILVNGLGGELTLTDRQAATLRRLMGPLVHLGFYALLFLQVSTYCGYLFAALLFAAEWLVSYGVVFLILVTLLNELFGNSIFQYYKDGTDFYFGMGDAFAKCASSQHFLLQWVEGVISLWIRNALHKYVWSHYEPTTIWGALTQPIKDLQKLIGTWSSYLESRM